MRTQASLKLSAAATITVLDTDIRQVVASYVVLLFYFMLIVQFIFE